MSEQCHTMGLVIRAKREKDVILTLLTPEMGKVTGGMGGMMPGLF